MGRRKISIQPITEERNRKVTFVKRKAGLFKKAHELAVLCQVDLAVIILGNSNNKFYEYNSVSIQDLLNNYKDPHFIHDIKVPGDYGDYKQESRAFKGVSTKQIGTHNRSTSLASVSEQLSSDEDDEDDEDDEEEDEEEEEEEEKRPTKRRKTSRKKEVKKETRQRVTRSKASTPTVQAKPGLQDSQIISPPHRQQQLEVQNHQPISKQTSISNQQLPTFQSQNIYYSNSQNIPSYSNGRPTHINLPRSSFPPISIDSNVMPPASQSGRDVITPQNSQNPFPLYPVIQFSPSTPISSRSQASSSGTPNIVPSSRNTDPAAYSSARARSLNDNISSRPILRVETHLSQLQKPPSAHTGNDSANTITALDTAKMDTSKTNSDEKTTSSGMESIDDIGPTGLGISSKKSTPTSATLPSGLFNIPRSQSLSHGHNQTHGVKGALGGGDQTPLTGGLPSRYVPDLFPSPSNFYSNEWNIPFGSGNTPYPNSAGPSNHTLPSMNSNQNSTNGTQGNNNVKGRLKSRMAGNDLTDSPLQHFGRDLSKLNTSHEKNGDIEGSRGHKVSFNQNDDVMPRKR